MRTEENRSFMNVESAELGPLLRLAVLLAWDRGQAEDLVQTSLMKSYRHWARITRSGTPSAYVRRFLVTTHTSWRRRFSFRVDRLRPAPQAAPGDAAVAEELDRVLSLTGLRPRSVTFTIVWAGDVPLETGDGSARVTLVAAELPSGAFYVTAVAGWDAGGGELRAAPCGSEIRPAGTPIDQQVFALGCDDIAAGQDVPFESLVVIAPPGTVTAQALTADGDVKYSYALTDGVAVAAAPTGGPTCRSSTRAAPSSTTATRSPPRTSATEGPVGAESPLPPGNLRRREAC